MSSYSVTLGGSFHFYRAVRVHAHHRDTLQHLVELSGLRVGIRLHVVAYTVYFLTDKRFLGSDHNLFKNVCIIAHGYFAEVNEPFTL